MRILVTGLCGRLGRALVNTVRDTEHELIGLDCVDWPADHQPLPPNVTLHRGRYEQDSILAKLMAGCDAVIHTAGPHGGHVDQYSLATFLQANVTHVANLLETARRHVRSVVLSSTMEVVIGPQWAGHGPTVLDETAAPRPGSIYPISRYTMEALARSFALHHQDLSVAVLRFMAFGYKPDERLGPSLLARALSAEDAAAAALAACHGTDYRGELFHIGPRTPITAPLIAQALEDPQSTLEQIYPGANAVLKANDFQITARNFWPVADITKARRLLGYEPSVTFASWLADHGWQNDSPAPSVRIAGSLPARSRQHT
jgi:nucleoside-diphosphate-sugar epimerase